MLFLFLSFLFLQELFNVSILFLFELLLFLLLTYVKLKVLVLFLRRSLTPLVLQKWLRHRLHRGISNRYQWLFLLVFMRILTFSILHIFSHLNQFWIGQHVSLILNYFLLCLFMPLLIIQTICRI